MVLMMWWLGLVALLPSQDVEIGFVRNESNVVYALFLSFSNTIIAFHTQECLWDGKVNGKELDQAQLRQLWWCLAEFACHQYCSFWLLGLPLALTQLLSRLALHIIAIGDARDALESYSLKIPWGWLERWFSLQWNQQAAEGVVRNRV